MNFGFCRLLIFLSSGMLQLNMAAKYVPCSLCFGHMRSKPFSKICQMGCGLVPDPSTRRPFMTLVPPQTKVPTRSPTSTSTEPISHASTEQSAKNLHFRISRVKEESAIGAQAGTSGSVSFSTALICAGGFLLACIAVFTIYRNKKKFNNNSNRVSFSEHSWA